MDTQDPRFINAYNDLTAAFFRFMNVVNPAPSAEAQIQLICRSMQAIVDTLRQAGNAPVQSAPVFDTAAGTAPAAPQQPVMQQPAPQPATVTQPVAQPAAQPAPAARAAWEEKRFAPMPATTSEDIYKFMFKQLKREEAFQPNEFGDYCDMSDYPFMIEFTGTEGVFTPNGEIIMNADSLKEMPADLIKVEGSLSGQPKLSVMTPGSIEKSTGGWEVKKPIIIIAQ